MANENDLLLKTAEILQGLSGRLDKVEKSAFAGTAHTATQIHGVDGMFANGVERDVINAHMRMGGIASVLPLLPTVTEDPRFPSITGFSASSGQEPTLACSDAPTAYMKGATLTARFGMIRRDTQVIDMEKAILRKNRGDFDDLILHGQLLDMDVTPSKMSTQDMLNVVTKAEMVTASVSAGRKLGIDLWQGTVAANQMPGLDVQVATGQVDAETNIAAPALDSLVLDFNFADLGGTVRDIVEYLSFAHYELTNRSERMGLDPVKFILALRPDAWMELSAVWPCRYNTNRCTSFVSGSTNVAVMNDGINVKMRDDMRNGKFIDINGERIPVVVDGGIYEYTNITSSSVAAGKYASSIYLLPLVISGGMKVLYRQYLDFKQAQPEIEMLNGMNTFWTDDGVYTWAVETNKWCYKLALKTEQRVVLRTPQLAAKIQKVLYSPLQHLRDADPASTYWKDGGVSFVARDPGYAVWDNR